MTKCKYALAIAGSALFWLAAPVLLAEEPASSNDAPAPQLTMMGSGLRVAGLAQSLRFFRDGLGMVEVARFSTSEFDEVVLGFGEGSSVPPIFLLQSRDRKAKIGRRPIIKGEKIILSTSDISALASRLAAMGYAVEPITLGTGGTMQTFVLDPDGHRFEIIQKLPKQR